ncbi:MAG: bifunctional phosphopantothenoylcysteine decarboxylase/phosphopantothenate--cysteine ligase CoaBC [Candidatus Levybacteria bacterium]|nr:bifunctional phosphopantothenoylcysteine decarboxylase/phosphopantothenate--cysteine ligase CoaBC [Candidatus Levybacteria bacterium]
MQKTVILGVTSGIAAYKTIDLVKLLKKEDINVLVIMTDHAATMVSPDLLQKASENTVSKDLFEKAFDYKRILKSRVVDHIKLADSADCMVIAPATANVIAKLAHGIADDFLTTTALAVTKPIVLCPSMNVHMWNNPAVQENLTILKKRGYIIVEPEEGLLACGYEGVGRLAAIEVICETVKEQLTYTHPLKGKKILVTAGGTKENIDDVRYITNRSSGKMGVAIAQECFLRGADVLLLRAKHAVKPRYLIAEKEFSTAEELQQLMQHYVKDYQYLYHAAAVSDFSVANITKGKLPSDKKTTIQLKPQIKIVDQIKQLNPMIKLIAFKATYTSDKKDLIQIGLQRLQQAKADAIIVNDVSQPMSGFESDQNEVFIVLPNGKSMHLPLDTKANIAKKIVSYL